MGLLDKAKSFLGGHGVTVRHVAIARVDPATAALALADSTVSCTFAVTAAADQPCTVLAMRCEVALEIRHPDGRLDLVPVGRHAVPEPAVARAPELLQYPFGLAAGQQIEDAFDVILDGSLEAILAQRALSIGGDVRIVLRTVVDVEGSPFDPEAVSHIAITP